MKLGKKLMMINSRRWNTVPWLGGLLALLASISSCSWTPQVETEIHNGPRGIVSLRTVGDDGLQADHPVEIKVATMERVLRGAHSFRDVRLIENLIGGDPKPVRLFSRSQIAFLAPHLTSALAQATPEEEVFFQCTAEPESAPPIIGNILVHHSTLFFRWKEPLSKPNVLAKQHRETSGLRDPSMPQEHTIKFFPKEAIRVEDEATQKYKNELGENTLAIDYLVLAGLPNSAFEIPELEEDGESSGQESGPKAEEPSNPEVLTSEEPRTDKSTAGSRIDSQSKTKAEADSELRELQEQMEELQKEMTKQQEELERLKNEKP